MAAFHQNRLVLVLLVIGCLLSSGNARETPSNHGHLTLEQRLSAGGIGDCWNALVHLKSCTNEIVLFFLNGESYLGMECCRAIRVITHQCWPSMLSSIGFTAEEGDILRGYCDATVSVAPGTTPPAPPPAGAAARTTE